MKSRRQLTCELAGASKAKIMPNFDAVLAAVHAVYPGAHREGASAGWSWTDDDGRVVASSCFMVTPPFVRHWLAIRQPEPAANTEKTR
jgi:hypothetical protein